MTELGGIVARVPGRAAAAPGEKLTITAPADKLHWFDAGGSSLED